MNAGALVRDSAMEMHDGAGGQAFYATAGEKDLSGLVAAVEKAKSFFR